VRDKSLPQFVEVRPWIPSRPTDAKQQTTKANEDHPQILTLF